jgi:hypothetical protein
VAHTAEEAEVLVAEAVANTQKWTDRVRQGISLKQVQKVLVISTESLNEWKELITSSSPTTRRVVGELMIAEAELIKALAEQIMLGTPSPQKGG